jgi:hypothetical protein
MSTSGFVAPLHSWSRCARCASTSVLAGSSLCEECLSAVFAARTDREEAAQRALEAAWDLPGDGHGPEHADYPHEPGRLYDCQACEASCHCTADGTECVWSGHALVLRDREV